MPSVKGPKNCWHQCVGEREKHSSVSGDPSPTPHRLCGEDFIFLDPSAPPGFPPKSLVAPEVFEEMQLYTNCIDPEERRIREFNMKKTLRDLSLNPGAQNSYLRLEDPPRISGVQNKNIGRVFDYRTATTEEDRLSGEGALNHEEADEGQVRDTNGITMKGSQLENLFLLKPPQTEIMKMPQEKVGGSGEHLPLRTGVTFSMGHDDHSTSGASGRSKSSKRKGASWKRLRQTHQGIKDGAQSDLNKLA